MKTPRRSKSLSLAIAGLIALPSLSFALPPLVKVTVQNWNTQPTFNDGESSSFISRSLASANNSNGRASSSGSASFGVIRARSEAVQLAGGTPAICPMPVVYARYRDNRVTNAPGRTGQTGFVTVKFTVEGTQVLEGPHGTANQSHYSWAEYNLLVDGGIASRRVWVVWADGQPPNCGDSCIPFLNIEQTVTYPVTFGTPYDFELNLKALSELRSYPGFPGGARVVTDMANTATWGGIVSVTDVNGNPITDYTDTAASGTNYVAPIAPQCAPPSGALIGWWPGDNNARDIEGGNNGALENGVTYGAGRVGQSFSFSTVGARVHVPHAAALDFNATQNYTIDFWMKAGPQSGSERTLVEKNGGTYPYSVRMLPTGFVTAGFSDATNPTSVTSTGTPGKVDDNLWHHIAVVFKHSAQVLELYVDGSLNATQTYTATLGPLANGQDVYFGARSDSSNSFAGSIDEVDISNGALSLAEIQSIVAAASLGKCRAPVAATSAVSRKTHGAAGDFDINLPFSGTLGVEGRGTSGSHKIVFTFPAAVTFSAVSIPSGTAGGATASSPTPTEVVVDLTGVTNGQWLTVNLVNVDDGVSTNDVAVRLGVLTGDTNGSGGVSASDVGQTKSQSGEPVTATNFRQDANVSGGNISASDIGLVKSKSGDVLPPP